MELCEKVDCHSGGMRKRSVEYGILTFSINPFPQDSLAELKSVSLWLLQGRVGRELLLKSKEAKVVGIQPTEQKRED